MLKLSRSLLNGLNNRVLLFLREDTLAIKKPQLLMLRLYQKGWQDVLHRRGKIVIKTSKKKRDLSIPAQ